VAVVVAVAFLAWILVPGTGEKTTSAPPVANLTASASSIERGEAVTLSWKTDHARSVRLEPLGTVPASGSRVVEPSVTTNYRLVAVGTDETATDGLTIEVTGPPPVQSAAVIDEFTASRTTIAAGETVTLTWRTSNAEKVELPPLDNLPLSGSHDIRLTKDTAFVLVAYGAGGNAQKALNVSVTTNEVMDAAEARVFLEKVLAEAQAEIDRGDIAAARVTAERAMAYERLPPEYQARLKDAVSAMIAKAGAAESSYEPIVRVPPAYPARALSRGLEGHVDLEFTVTAAGTVAEPKVVASTSSVFDRAAVQAVLKYKYKPRVVDGKAVETPGVRTRVVFEIDE
jgi:TonB family protein